MVDKAKAQEAAEAAALEAAKPPPAVTTASSQINFATDFAQENTPQITTSVSDDAAATMSTGKKKRTGAGLSSQLGIS